MQRRTFGREFMIEVVRRVRKRGVSVAQAACDLGVRAAVKLDCAPLRIWVHCPRALRQRRIPAASWGRLERPAQMPMTPMAAWRSWSTMTVPVRTLARFIPALGTAEAAHHRQLAPVDWVQETVLAPDLHGVDRAVTATLLRRRQMENCHAG